MQCENLYERGDSGSYSLNVLCDRVKPQKEEWLCRILPYVHPNVLSLQLPAHTRKISQQSLQQRKLRGGRPQDSQGNPCAFHRSPKGIAHKVLHNHVCGNKDHHMSFPE